ncbi:MAG: TonB-dependent receptor plug domain-containing protein [Bacteroidales bacterium]|nr:TonB-dependent receptor plug domain-containing protein [Bacteroidales bacterium]MCM1146263.1 TonB-dependent receptor plug domain-containing protein [Bacteroidales bacterium]MCM1205299.1 TonB-dependent receptor plug domain-containing protein [Bacillota bacterium]MCM1509614.1 TonB-dependent receptor plug domain-containing protein [Clostridium sp.]
MKKTVLSLGILMSAQLVCAGGVNEKSVSNSASVNPTELSDTTITLQEVSIRGNFCNEKETPLNLTTITPQDIRLHFTSPNYVEMLNGVPGVYATASTGSYGDASLNMRGFKQENISIMLNGIPIQGLTSGSMYWSNWMGLAEATYSVQVQKGMGGSMLADCAMGGMVNIITKTGNGLPNGSFALSVTDEGLTKGVLNYSTGTLRHGWNVDAMVSYTRGHGFVECSDVSTFSYMLSISKLLGAHNTLVFTALGSPEVHDQRNTELSAAEVEKYGRGYSKNWGWLNGEKYSIGRNHYYKPYFTLQHILDGERFSMKNSLYLAIANGGGRSTYGQKGSVPIISHQTPDGHIDFDAVQAENRASENGSQNIMLDYLSGHTQAGAIASAEYSLTKEAKVLAGIQYQYYDTWSKMKVLDLLGGDYWYDSTTKQNVGAGDYTGARYGRTTHHASGYVQGQYATGRLNANVGVSLFSGTYSRHDDISGARSRWAHGFGGGVRGGLLYHILKAGSDGKTALSAYANAGYNSRLPYAGVYLASSDLSVTNDIANEKNLLGEIGMRASWQGGGAELSGYIASWRDKTLTVNITKRANEAAEKYNITGLNALHRGIELSLYQQLLPWLRAKAFFSTASWRWKSDGKGVNYDSFSGETLKEYKIYCNNLHVGDAPQTQAGLTLDGRIPLSAALGSKAGALYFNVSWQMNARMYADFEPSSRTEEGAPDAYRLPAYHLVDATAGWEGRVAKGLRLNIFACCKNLFDADYIERGIDGTSHDLESFRGYWGAPRQFSFGMRLAF